MAMAEKQNAADRTSEEALALLRRQAVLYERLESYADRQRTLVAADDTGSLLSVLSDRQRLSVELGQVTHAFEPIRRVWSDFRRCLTPGQRAEAEQLLLDIKDRLRSVIEGDEEDARLLSARKQTVADGLRSLHSTGRALHAYGSRAESTSAVGLDEAT